MTIVSEIVERGKNIESLKNERLRRRSVRHTLNILGKSKIKTIKDSITQIIMVSHTLNILRKNMLLPERDIPYFDTEERDIEKACGTIKRAKATGKEALIEKYSNYINF